MGEAIVRLFHITCLSFIIIANTGETCIFHIAMIQRIPDIITLAISENPNILSSV